MKNISAIVLMSCSLTLAGCATLDHDQPTKVTPDEVLTGVKQEVDYLQQYLLKHEISFATPEGQPLCTAAQEHGDSASKSVPITTLKGKAIITSIVTHETDLSGQLGPSTGVVSLNASYSRNQTNGQTQTIEYDFSAPEPKKRNDLKLDDIELAKHPIASTAYAALTALSKASHQPPCLKATTVSVTVNFTAQKKTDAGGELGYLLFKVGADQVGSSELDHSLELDFDLGIFWGM